MEGQSITNIEPIKKELIDPRTISKKLDPEGRNKTAEEILKVRATAKDTRESINSNEEKIRQIAELTTDLFRRQRQKTAELTKRLESLAVKIKRMVGVDDEQALSLQEEINATILDY